MVMRTNSGSDTTETSAGRRRSRVWFAGAGIIVIACCVAFFVSRDEAPTTHEPPVDSGPNVLLIVLDTTRADVFSSYGHPRQTTPRMDALAAQGSRYARAYATNCWTLPSHASMLSGLYPTAAGATSETNHFPEQTETLAEMLKDAGYNTAAVVCNPWLTRERGFAQGFDEFVEMWREAGPSPLPPSEEREDQRAGGEVAASIHRLSAKRAPFFLFVNINLAHLPYTPPEDLQARFVSENWRSARISELRGIMEEWAYLAGALELDEADLRIMRGLYEAEVAHSDQWVGMALDALTQCGILDDTLVVVTADHGEYLGDHGLIGHPPGMHEALLHVPLIIRYPERFPKGAVSNELVSLLDLTPTVLDVCGLLNEPEAPFSAARSYCREGSTGRTFVMAENERPVNGLELLANRFPEFDRTKIDHALRMLRTDRYKLIWRSGAKAELFCPASVEIGECRRLSYTYGGTRRRTNHAESTTELHRGGEDGHPAGAPD